MNAGRELDALVAEHVMGREVVTWALAYVESEAAANALGRWHHGLFSEAGFAKGGGGEVFVAVPHEDYSAITYYDPKHGWHGVPHYSTDLAAAWQALEKLQSDWDWGLDYSPPPSGAISYECTFYHRESGRTHVSEMGESIPHVICLAALQAVGYEVA